MAILGVKEIETGQLYDCKLLCEQEVEQVLRNEYGTMWIGEKTGNEEIQVTQKMVLFLHQTQQATTSLSSATKRL
jgi:hypothetical protein